MGIVISISTSCIRHAQEVRGVVAVTRSYRRHIERSEVGYVVDLDAGVIALAPKICFRQSDAALSAEAVREELSEHFIDADTFAVVLTNSTPVK